MNHIFYSDGNATKISWIIQTDGTTIEQNREHVEMYKNKITNLQSKYVALHVGLFWGVGEFIIENKDTIKIKIDEKIMFEQITKNMKTDDQFIQKRIKFINQLIAQRQLKIDYEIIEKDN